MADYTYHEAPAQKVTALPVAVPAKLIGRDAVLGQIYTRLRENQPVMICGAAGSGKTALAATLAAAYTDQPGGVLWLNSHNDTFEELIVRVGRAYNVAEITRAEYPLGMVGAVASTLTHHKPLIVLDGILNPEAVTTFLARCVDSLPVLLVTQEAFGQDDWPVETLKPLEPTAGASLLRQAAGLGTESNPDIERLAERLRYMPLALVVAGGSMRATRQGATHFISAIEGIPGVDKADPALVALTVAFRNLNNALQGLMLMLGAMFRGEATPELLSRIGNAPQETIQQVMRILSQQYLLEQTERYDMLYYRLHPLIQRFAQTLAGEPRLNELRNRIAAELVNFTQEYASQAQPEGHNRLAALMDCLLAAAEWSAAHKNTDIANQLSMALMRADDFINQRGYVYELLKLRRLSSSSTTPFPASPMPVRDHVADSIATDAMTEDDDDAIEAEEEIPVPGYLQDFLDGDDEDEPEDNFVADEDESSDDDDDDDDEVLELPRYAVVTPFADTGVAEDDDDSGIVGAYIPEIPQDDTDEDQAAIRSGDINALRAALVRARQAEKVDRQLALMIAMGESQLKQGQQNEAISTYSDIVALYDERDDDEDLLDVLDRLSALMVQTENAQPAILHANRGIQLAQELEDDAARMRLATTLGDARQQLGESSAAEVAYEQALEIARQEGDKLQEALILLKLGYAQLDSSDANAASATWELALPLFRDQQKHDYEGKVLGALGTAYGELDRWNESMRFHTSALHLARAVGDREEELLQLSNLAYAAVQAEELGQAVLHYRQALHLAYESDDRENIISTIVDLAGLLARSPRHLGIARLLIDDAAQRDPNDRDVKSLQQRITNEMLAEDANAVKQKDVLGTAQAYAANAYRLLDD